MKGLKGLLVAALLVLSGGSLAWADATQGGEIRGADSSPIKTVTVSAHTSSAGDFQAGRYILGFKLYANDAADSCGLYDVATAGAAAVAVLIDEWTEATDEETNVQMWPFPYKLTTDLSVLTNGVCVIYYQ